MRPLMKDPAAGAATSVHLASAPGLERETGGYYAKSRARRSSFRSHDEVVAARLWQLSAELVGLPRLESRESDPHAEAERATNGRNPRFVQ